MFNVRWNSRIAAVFIVVVIWSILGSVSTQGKKKVDVAIVLDQYVPQVSSHDCRIATFIDLMAEFRPANFDFDTRLGVFMLKTSSLATMEPFSNKFKDDEGRDQIASQAFSAARILRSYNAAEFEGVMRGTKRTIENETTNRDDAMDVIIWFVAELFYDLVRSGIDDQIKTKYAHAFIQAIRLPEDGCRIAVVGKVPTLAHFKHQSNQGKELIKKIIGELVTQQVENEKCYTTEKWSEQCFFYDPTACRTRIRKVHVCAIEETTDTPCKYDDHFCKEMCDTDTQWNGSCRADCGGKGYRFHRSQKAVDGNDPNYVNCPMREEECFNDCNPTSPTNQPHNITMKKTTTSTSPTNKPPKKSTRSQSQDAATPAADDSGLQIWHYVVIVLGVLAVVAIVAAVIIVLFFMKGKGSSAEREKKNRIEDGRGVDGASKIERSRRFGMSQGSSVVNESSRNRSPSRRVRGRPGDRRR